MNPFRRILRCDEGATMVDYGLIVALVSAAVLTSVAVIGPKVKSIFQTMTAAIDVSANPANNGRPQNPVVAAIPPISVFSGDTSTTLAVAAAVSDPNGAPFNVAFVSGSTYSGTLSVAYNGAMTLTPPYDGSLLPSSGSTTLVAIDTLGASTTFAVPITVLPGRLMVAPQTVNFGACASPGSGTLRVYNYRSSDPNAVTLSFSGAPAWWGSTFSITSRSYDAPNNQVVFNFTATAGSGPVSGLNFFATASDSGGHTGSGQITFNCSP